MNALRNKVQLIGNLGMNPELRKLDSGSSVAKFTMATSESYVNKKGERVDYTQWHNVVAWGKIAELMGELLAKGKEVMVEGKLTSRSWDDKEGNKRYITEVVASEFLLMTRDAKKQEGDLPF
jgi:single-strand DNA-binding protein